MSTKQATGNKTLSCPYVQFEERAAGIYLEMARLFKSNQDLSWFWLGMSSAEKQHALVLAFCEQQRILGSHTPSHDREFHDLSEMFSKVEARLRRRDLSIDDAFLLAAELETSEINAIYDNLVRPVEGTTHFMRKKIETLGENHPEILLRAARKFGASAQVVEKLSQLQMSSTRSKGHEHE